ncbi:hypothetical protein N0V90_006977 [Kalmusia sp. IMI 367209]|nr:hypothetical protein N0V90_006977 [Kalmusia sp. IMI 367209]
MSQEALIHVRYDIDTWLRVLQAVSIAADGKEAIVQASHTSVHYHSCYRVVGQDGFTTADFTARQYKREVVFTIAYQWLATRNRPIELSRFAGIIVNPAIDEKPIINFMIYWKGEAVPANIPIQ